MAADLADLLLAHAQRPRHCLLTMLTFTTSTPSSCGIVETDATSVVTAFHEKVAEPSGNKANGALYAFDADFLAFAKQMSSPPSDFSTEVIPALMGKIYTWHTTKAYLDIGTTEMLEIAQKLWEASA
jgi:mannose-1-phosphate guanylyltransferase